MSQRLAALVAVVGLVGGAAVAAVALEWPSEPAIGVPAPVAPILATAPDAPLGADAPLDAAVLAVAIDREAPREREARTSVRSELRSAGPGGPPTASPDVPTPVPGAPGYALRVELVDTDLLPSSVMEDLRSKAADFAWCMDRRDLEHVSPPPPYEGTVTWTGAGNTSRVRLEPSGRTDPEIHFCLERAFESGGLLGINADWATRARYRITAAEAHSQTVVDVSPRRPSAAPTVRVTFTVVSSDVGLAEVQRAIRGVRDRFAACLAEVDELRPPPPYTGQFTYVNINGFWSVNHDATTTVPRAFETCIAARLGREARMALLNGQRVVATYRAEAASTTTVEVLPSR
jgi:hypothetical protein